MVNKPIQYFKDTDANFVITCTFTGNETPTGAEWTHKTKAVVSGQGDYTLNYDNINKKSTLTKSKPTMTTDDGDYECKFKMATVTTHEPTSKSAVTVVREYCLQYSSNYYLAFPHFRARKMDGLLIIS